jgi:hypothetical protein
MVLACIFAVFAKIMTKPALKLSNAKETTKSYNFTKFLKNLFLDGKLVKVEKIIFE